jgi:hypothetical protein
VANPVALKDPTAGNAVQMGGGVQMLTIMPQNIGEVSTLADRMAASRFVPPHLRDKPGDCFAVVMQSLRWGMDPYAVASKTYFVNDRMAYEAQLVNAVVYARAPLDGRLDIKWEGAWPARICTVTGMIKGDKNPKVRRVDARTITTRNSPLWKSDPDQQIAYFATRAWARLFAPDVLMGVYTPDEFDEESRADNARDITPAAKPAPQATTRLDAMEAAIAGDGGVPADDNFGLPAVDGNGEVVDESEPKSEETIKAEAWVHDVALPWFPTARTAEAVDKWLKNFGNKLEQVRAIAPDAAMEVVTAADARKKEFTAWASAAASRSRSRRS